MIIISETGDVVDHKNMISSCTTDNAAKKDKTVDRSILWVISIMVVIIGCIVYFIWKKAQQQKSNHNESTISQNQTPNNEKIITLEWTQIQILAAKSNDKLHISIVISLLDSNIMFVSTDENKLTISVYDDKQKVVSIEESQYKDCTKGLKGFLNGLLTRSQELIDTLNTMTENINQYMTIVKRKTWPIMSTNICELTFEEFMAELNKIP